MQVGIAYLGLAAVAFFGGAFTLPENPTVGHLLFVPMFGLLYAASRSMTNTHYLGIGYLSFSGLFILGGFFISTSSPLVGFDGYIVGDLLMASSIVLIYLGSKTLDDPEAAITDEDPAADSSDE